MAFFANMRFWQLKTRSSIVICFRSSLTIGLGICGVEIYDCQISNNLGGGNYDGMGIYSEYSGVVFFFAFVHNNKKLLSVCCNWKVNCRRIVGGRGGVGCKI